MTMQILLSLLISSILLVLLLLNLLIFWNRKQKEYNESRDFIKKDIVKIKKQTNVGSNTLKEDYCSNYSYNH